MRRTALLFMLLALLFGHIAALRAEPRPEVSFVGCPLYRDTDAGRKSGCWLAEDPASGIRYDIGEGPTKPQVGKQVLIEGVLADEPDACGGRLLRPVRIAVIEEACPAVILPAEHHPGRRFVLPDEVMQPTWEPRPVPAPPYAPQRFTLQFDFGNDFLIYQHAETILERAAIYAKASNARIRIDAFAATAPITVSGRTFVEPYELARARGAMVAEALTRLGIEASRLQVQAHGDPQPDPAAALPEASKRRVDIHILPR